MKIPGGSACREAQASTSHRCAFSMRSKEVGGIVAHMLVWKFMKRNVLNIVYGFLLIFIAVLQPTSIAIAEQESYVAGELLVATEQMKDPRFVETVIYIVRHNEEGAFGLVINRPLAKGPIEDLLKGFGVDSEGAKGEIVLNYGGPVGTERGFVLHSDDFMLDTSTALKNGLALTTDPALIQALSRGKGPSQYLLLFGYAGWAPHQLENEIKAQAWFTIPAEKALIFDKDINKKWQHAMDRRRIRL